MGEPGGSALQKYRRLCYGDVSGSHVLWAELVTLLVGTTPGALGLFLRKHLYPALFAECGEGVLFGRSLTIRHGRKITVGDNTILDDHVVLDAKGDTNRGIVIGRNVFIGRNSIVYCKNGDITLEDGVNISSNCTIFSSNSVTIRAGTMVGAYSYLLSGGEYDMADPTPFAEQTGMKTQGPLVVGANGWLGTRVTVLDAAGIGDHCVIGACSLVTGAIPANSLAYGVPARVVRSL